MKHKVFVDSDVVIDFFTDREPFVASATALFELGERGNLQLFISAVSINNIYYIVRRHLGHTKTLQVVEELISMAEVVGTTKQEISLALSSNFADFEDSIQYASALNIDGLSAIITRNIKDFKNAEVEVLTPGQFLQQFNLTL
jgi:predicted nucleic acid-binding protein